MKVEFTSVKQIRVQKIREAFGFNQPKASLKMRTLFQQDLGDKSVRDGSVCRRTECKTRKPGSGSVEIPRPAAENRNI